MRTILTLVLAAAVAVLVSAAYNSFFAERTDAQLNVSASVAAHAADTVSNPEIDREDRILGDENAKVTILEYSSLTCPHCAQFHAEGYRHLKSTYIDTGKVRLVFRDFPLDELALRAAALAECVPPGRYFPFLQLLFEGQSSWARTDQPLVELVRLGQLAGLGQDRAAECLQAEPGLEKIIKERLVGQETYQIDSTPSFIIDGRKYPGILTADELDEILAPLLG
ncbi:MAG: thioredoxin domain-containing protein [Alphaproteobacteria bacterium]|nr:thioredoxin domain-containing protein [Alphaproteobacteria bacterium]